MWRAFDKVAEQGCEVPDQTRAREGGGAPGIVMLPGLHGPHIPQAGLNMPPMVFDAERIVHQDRLVLGEVQSHCTNPSQGSSRGQTSGAATGWLAAVPSHELPSPASAQWICR